jgi:hypothetical protein
MRESSCDVVLRRTPKGIGEVTEGCRRIHGGTFRISRTALKAAEAGKLTLTAEHAGKVSILRRCILKRCLLGQ